MNAIPPSVPAPVAEDATDVSTALDVAGALWEKGDRAEAVRWLYRAAEAATATGNGERASDLAESAHALQAVTEGRSVATPTVPPPPEALLSSIRPTSSASAQEPWPESSERALAPAAVPADAVAGGFASLDGRMRVSVKTSVRDPRLFVVRPLAEGEAAPAGTLEGFLSVVDSLGKAPKKLNGGGAA
jgi:hypothetical protein